MKKQEWLPASTGKEAEGMHINNQGRVLFFVECFEGTFNKKLASFENEGGSFRKLEETIS